MKKNEVEATTGKVKEEQRRVKKRRTEKITRKGAERRDNSQDTYKETWTLNSQGQNSRAFRLLLSFFYA